MSKLPPAPSIAQLNAQQALMNEMQTSMLPSLKLHQHLTDLLESQDAFYIFRRTTTAEPASHPRNIIPTRRDRQTETKSSSASIRQAAEVPQKTRINRRVLHQLMESVRSGCCWNCVLRMAVLGSTMFAINVRGLFDCCMDVLRPRLLPYSPSYQSQLVATPLPECETILADWFSLLIDRVYLAAHNFTAEMEVFEKIYAEYID